MCSMANRTAEFGSHGCIWTPSVTLEPVFYRVSIWHLIGEESLYLGNERSCPIMYQMKALMKSLMKIRFGLSQAERASAFLLCYLCVIKLYVLIIFPVY